jgi:hypothetical protein
MNQFTYPANHSIEKPRYICSFDTETVDGRGGFQSIKRHKLELGVALYGEFRERGGKLALYNQRELVFHTSAEFWRALYDWKTGKNTVWIFAHNLPFDLSQVDFWSELREGRLRFTFPGAKRYAGKGRSPYKGLMLIDDPPTVLCVETESNQRFLLMDSLNYFRLPLAEVGRSFGLEKLPIDFKTASYQEKLVYCRNDTQIVETAMVDLLRWWKEQDLGKFRYTAASLAFHAYFHRFNQVKIQFHNYWRCRKMERAVYFGGQLEAFYLGEIKQPFHVLDVTSLYPFVMRSNKYPVRVRAFDSSCGLSADKPPIELNQSLCQVELGETCETFPYRTPEGMQYSLGPGVFWLAGPELQYAYDQGYIQRWGKWAHYVCRPLFTEYVDYFFALKKKYTAEGDKARATFCKLLLNSLYGKFGQKGGRWQLIDELPSEDGFYEWRQLNLPSKKITRYLVIWDRQLQYMPVTEVHKAAPILAAFVTSYARQYMRQLRQLAGLREVYYQATDSLFTSEKGMDNLDRAGYLRPDELGGLHDQGRAEDGEIYNLHWYRVGDQWTTGGAKKSATFSEQFKWQEPHFDSLVSMVARGGKNEVVIQEVEKERTPEYKKGIVESDGWVTPYTALDLAPVNAFDQNAPIGWETLQLLEDGC